MTRRLLTAAGLGFALASFQLTACKSSKKTSASARNASGNSVCSSVPYREGEPVVRWVGFAVGYPMKLKGATLPSVYDAYILPDSELKAAFSYARSNKTRISFAFPAPNPLGCQYYELSNSGAMSGDLAAKYPDIYSFKGSAVSLKNSDLRVDYSAGALNAQLMWEGNTYLMKTLDYDGRKVVIVYDKANTSDVKQPFEQNVPRQTANPFPDK